MLLNILIPVQSNFLLRDTHGEGEADAHHDPVSEDETIINGDGKLVCARCKHAITDEKQQTSRHGSHIHTFTNPAGVEFTIGCFVSAPGCKTSGNATMEYTWFPKYQWRFAECANCRQHLGWQYIGNDDFFGLILACLQQAH